MEIKINTNFWYFAGWVALFVTLLLGLMIALRHAQDYYSYQKYISDNTKSNIQWYYNCDSNFYSQFYNCPQNETLKNLTGYYCRNNLICQNSYKILE